MALFIVALQPVITVLYPSLAAVSVGVLLPAYLSLGPLFWLYVVGLTQETLWRPERSDMWHFLPASIAAVTVGLSIYFPDGVLDSLVVEGDARPLFDGVDQASLTFVGYTVIFIFVLVLLWLVQSACYMFSVLRRLVRYRVVLKDLFASNERRELGWIIGVLLTTCGIWLLTAVALLLENFADLTLFGGVARAGDHSGADLAHCSMGIAAEARFLKGVTSRRSRLTRCRNTSGRRWVRSTPGASPGN